MADLMKGSVTYEQLADKYANFVVPAAKVFVDGDEVIEGRGYVIYELEVRLSIDLAGSAVIKFAYIYDVGSHAFGGGIQSMFRPGTVVEIALGYLSATEKVFKGYVEMAGVEMDGMELFVVTLMDVKRLMMSSGVKSVLHQASNYSDVFSQVMDGYSAVCSAQVEATSDDLEEPVAQYSNDYEFIAHELIGKGRADREFLVYAGVAYFRRPHSVTQPVTTLRYGRELQSFAVSHCYKDLKIEVIGADENEEIVRGEAQVTGNISQKSILSPTPVYTVTDPYATTSSRANLRAQAIALREKERSCVGGGSVLGMPEIVPGRYVKVENADAMVDMKYYVTEVTHLYTQERFLTQFEVGGC